MNEIWKKGKKNIIILCCFVIVCAGMFCAGRFTRVRNAPESGIRAEEQLKEAKRETEKLREELDQRIRDIDTISAESELLRSTIGSASDIVEQSGITIRQLGSTVDSIKSESSDIGDTIRKLREGQRAIKAYVEQLEKYNNELEREFRELQESTGKQ